MAITVTIGESKKAETKDFPKLMKSGKTLVYFTSYGCGFLIVNTRFASPHYSEDWNMPKFTDYNEPITLQND